MFNKDQIDNFLLIEKLTNENKFKDDSHSIKLKLLNVKFLIDRWDNVSTDLIIHPIHKTILDETFGHDTSKQTIWGIRVHYTPDINANCGLMLSLADGKLVNMDNPGRCMAKFNV